MSYSSVSPTQAACVRRHVRPHLRPESFLDGGEHVRLQNDPRRGERRRRRGAGGPDGDAHAAHARRRPAPPGGGGASSWRPRARRRRRKTRRVLDPRKTRTDIRMIKTAKNAASSRARASVRSSAANGARFDASRVRGSPRLAPRAPAARLPPPGPTRTLSSSPRAFAGFEGGFGSDTKPRARDMHHTRYGQPPNSGGFSDLFGAHLGAAGPRRRAPLERRARARSCRVAPGGGGDYSWSPDGQWLAFSATDETEFSTVNVWRVDTGEVVRLTHPRTTRWNPSFPPTGFSCITFPISKSRAARIRRTGRAVRNRPSWGRSSSCACRYERGSSVRSF